MPSMTGAETSVQCFYPSIETYSTQYYTDAFKDIAENINIRIRGSTTSDTFELMETIIKNPDENYSEITARSNFDYASEDLFMLRDSFARAMFPYFASVYDKSVFVKSCSYDAYVYPIEDYSNFLFETVERNLTDILETEQKITAPVREAVNIENDVSNDTSNGSSFNFSDEYSDYLYIDGTIDSKMIDANSDIYVVINDASGSSVVYEAFPGGYEESTDTYQYYLTVDNLESGEYTAYTVVNSTAVASGEINIK
ncbi:MAG: hypothetical protein LUG95_01490 [Clostridiales bacterium]|nr:hypothetical protein [Clostridiales bacterium]